MSDDTEHNWLHWRLSVTEITLSNTLTSKSMPQCTELTDVACGAEEINININYKLGRT